MSNSRFNFLFYLQFFASIAYLHAQPTIYDINKFRTSSVNCESGNNNIKQTSSNLIWNDTLATLTKELGINLQKKNDYCYEDKWSELTKPVSEYAKSKNHSIWIGIWPKKQFNLSQYCKIFKLPGFKYVYSANLNEYIILFLETTVTPKNFIDNLENTRETNFINHFMGSDYKFHWDCYMAVSFSVNFGKPCNCDSVFKSIDTLKMISLVNDLRSKGCKCGDKIMPPVRTLKWNNQIEKIAFLHSKDMCMNDYFSHTGLDGSSPSDRAYRENYPYTLAENIGSGYRTEENVFEGWLNSPGHCQNMMDANFQEFAVAKSGKYWTMNLSAQWTNYYSKESFRLKENMYKDFINELVNQINLNRSVPIAILKSNDIKNINTGYPNDIQLPDKEDCISMISIKYNIESVKTDIKNQISELMKSDFGKALTDRVYTQMVSFFNLEEGVTICLFRPMDILYEKLKNITVNPKIEKNPKLMAIAFKQAKQYWYTQNNIKQLGFKQADYKEMLKTKNIKVQSSEMILVCDSTITTEEDLFKYLKNSKEYSKITNKKFNHVGYSRYMYVWTILLANLEEKKK